MTVLNPTNARLSLLRAVAAGQVWQSFEDDYPAIREDEKGQRTVTAAVRLLENEGWVRLPGGRSVFEVTPKGKRVLEAFAPAEVTE